MRRGGGKIEGWRKDDGHGINGRAMRAPTGDEKERKSARPDRERRNNEMSFPKRKPNRLKNHDYASDGVYFVTFCVKDRLPILWEGLEWTVQNPVVYSEILDARANSVAGRKAAHPTQAWKLSEYGKKAEDAILDMPEIYAQIQMEAYTIMPNHVHLLFSLKNADDQNLTVSNVICQLKGAVTKRIGYSIWQKSFHDHIVRNKDEHLNIARYIQDNPKNWERDCFYVSDDAWIQRPSLC